MDDNAFPTDPFADEPLWPSYAPGCWAEVRTWEQLLAANIRSLEGGLNCYPGHCGNVWSELEPIRVQLTMLNRGGLFTVFGQAGVELQEHGRVWAQRAQVDLLCTHDSASALEGAVASTRLVLLTSPTDLHLVGPEACITRVDDDPVVHAGHHEGLAAILHTSPLLAEDDRLDDLVYVTLFDPVWGDDQLLWWTLEKFMLF